MQSGMRESGALAAGLCLAFLAAVGRVPAPAAPTGRLVCGAPHSVAEALFVRQQRLLHEPLAEVAGRQSAPVPASVGEIALVEVTPEVVAPPNPFDLAGTGVRIAPAGDGAAVQGGRPGPEPAALEQGLPMPLEDDDFAVVELPFAFPYYGAHYTKAYVHSDGNLTFQYPEASSTERNFSRAFGGPPRIAPLFKDLDPSRGGQVTLDLLWDRVVITWRRVPVFRERGIGERQTFQAVLHAGGAVEFLYGDITESDAVVGVFAGYAYGGSTAVDWSAGAGAHLEGAGAYAEIFAAEHSFDEFGVVQAFYQQHDDAYDSLVVFNDVGLDASAHSLAHAYTVRNAVRGIGEPTYDYGSFLGSPRRLSAFVNMGPLSSYPASPYAPLPGLPHGSLLTVLAHEIAHRFLAYPRFLDPATGGLSTGLLGRQLAHWSFFFNSGASVLEGNAIRDYGAGASPRFETVGATQRYSALDQYLMGFLGPEEVPATFVVEAPPGAARLGAAGRAPRVGVRFDGVRKDIRVADIVAAEGVRRPDATVSQRHFRYAFVLLTEAGQPPSTESLGRLAALQRAWLTFFETHVGSRATATTSLAQQLHLSTWPAGGVIVGGTARARVTVADRSDTDFTVRLTASDGIVSVPATVTVPAGELHADFDVGGLAAGTTTLVAEAGAPGHDRAVTRLAVRDGYAGLVLESANWEELYGVAGETLAVPVQFRLRDENLVPYSGVRVSVAGDAAGTPHFVGTVTDQDGRVTVRWPLGTSAGSQRLVAKLTAAPGIAAEAEATVALARPSIGSAGVVNAASQQAAPPDGGFAPGSLVTILGSNLAGETSAGGQQEAAAPRGLPLSMGGTAVYANGVAVPLQSVSPGAITFQVPFEAQLEPLRLVVSTNFGKSAPAIVAVVAASPGIFPGRVRRAASDGTSADAEVHPAAGAWIEADCTGLGAVSPPGRTGLPGFETPLQRVSAKTEAWVDAVPAEVSFSGLSPAEAGVYVVRVKLPDDLRAGSHLLTVAVADRRSNPVAFESR